MSLTDAELNALLAVVAERASGDIVGKRDYALLPLFVATGMRRAEILSLRGRDLRLDDGLVITSRVKGGNYAGREVADPQVSRALLDYPSTAGRLHVLKPDAPVWTRHDRAGGPGEALSSHCYVKNLKRYARGRHRRISLAPDPPHLRADRGRGDGLNRRDAGRIEP